MLFTELNHSLTWSILERNVFWAYQDFCPLFGLLRWVLVSPHEYSQPDWRPFCGSILNCVWYLMEWMWQVVGSSGWQLPLWGESLTQIRECVSMSENLCAIVGGTQSKGLVTVHVLFNTHTYTYTPADLPNEFKMLVVLAQLHFRHFNRSICHMGFQRTQYV